jgi:hypothetical protein
MLLFSSPSQHGQALFLGKEPLKGTLRGHQNPLPAAVTRCVNCHGQGGTNITRALLLTARQRRGGPPSVYTPATFCKLLRSGVDPAYVLIAHEMPTYELSDADCAGLWEFLTEDGGADAKH